MNRSQTLLLLSLLTMTGLSGPAFAISEAELQESMTPRERKIDELRNGEIHQLQLVNIRQEEGHMQPDLLLRLAELYTEKYKLYFFKESESWGKKMEAYLALPIQQQKLRAKPVLDSNSSRQWLSKAVDVLAGIPRQKIEYSRIDEVYYFLAFNQWELNRKDESVKNFQKIIDSYPRSKFASEAYRYVADYAFANRDFSKAARFYEHAAKQVDTPARPRILYGLAWAKFKLQDYSGAVNTMKEAIVLGKANSDAAAKSGLALQRDAAESLALFYSEGGDVEQASNFFLETFGNDEGALVMRKLSEFYQRQGKYAKALAVNKQLLSLGGAAAKQGEEQRFEIMVASLNMANSKGDRGRQTALLKAMTAEFVTNAKEPAEDKAEILRTQVRKAATLAHKEGAKSNHGKESLERAEDLYRLYLSAYGNRIKSDDAADIHWYLADVLNQLGKHKEATGEYRFIIDMAAKDPAYKKYEKEASSAMVYAMDGYFKSKSETKKLDRNDGDQVIASIDTFVRTYPNDKDVPKYLARASGILVTSGRMDEARPRLLEIIEKHPQSKEAWDAAATLLKDAHDRKDADASFALSQRFLGNQALMAQDRKGDLRKSLEDVIERSKFDKTRKLEASDPLAAAKKYESDAASAKNSAVRMTELNNAAVNYGKAGDQANELRVYEGILAANPENEAAGHSMLAIANEHFLSGRYADAAGVFERFYRIYKSKLSSLKASTQKEALESLRSAALLRRALKDSERGGEDFRDLVEAANKGLGAARDAAGEFLFDVARRQRDEGNSTEAIKSFQKYSTAFPDGAHAVGSTMEAAALYVKLKEDEKAQNYYRATISKVKSKGSRATPEELGYAARARLELLAPLEEAFEGSPLRLPEKQLQADIKAKLQSMERLNKGYVEVMDFGDGQWGVEAFRRMALTYRSFGQKLEGAPIPEELSPEDKAKFKAQLKAVAAPVFLKVAETLDTALQKGEQLQVVGPTMARTYVLAAVNSAKPDRLPLIQEPDWSKPAEWIMGDQPASDEALEKYRSNLRNKTDDLASWIAIGNRHLLKGEDGLAEIFYLHAFQKNPKSPAAISNLAYLRGREGDLARALGGFKSALANDEFAVAPKKNITRLFMGAGLWRHASLNFRQLEVRSPNDAEVKRGNALASLATGKIPASEAGITDGDGDNPKMAQAMLALAKGDRDKAASILGDLSGHNEYAKLILEFWKTKENK
ncbi:MAG: tetratricopeptide repeat protein [Bdellovibrionota bacterium]